jgi:hypothetical protein
MIPMGVAMMRRRPMHERDMNIQTGAIAFATSARRTTTTAPPTATPTPISPTAATTLCRRNRRPRLYCSACSAAATATTTGNRRSFALDRQPAGADIDVQAFWLVSILIKLVAQDRDRDRQSADNQKEHVAARHGRNLYGQSNRECRIARHGLAPRRKGPNESADYSLKTRSSRCYFFTPSNSTSKISVAFGGITPPAPLEP